VKNCASFDTTTHVRDMYSGTTVCCRHGDAVVALLALVIVEALENVVRVLADV